MVASTRLYRSAPSIYFTSEDEARHVVGLMAKRLHEPCRWNEEPGRTRIPFSGTSCGAATDNYWLFVISEIVDFGESSSAIAGRDVHDHHDLPRHASPDQFDAPAFST
jgi:hypothetical protein